MNSIDGFTRKIDSLIRWYISLPRFRSIGLMLGIAGITIIFTPPGVSGVTTTAQHTFGIHPYILGVLMALGGWLITLLKPSLPLYLICTLPWALYTVSSVYFVIESHSAATVSIVYIGVYVAVFREAFEIK